MKENRVKRILREGGLALGTHVGGIADPQIVELIGLAGFDAAFIDMEHTSFDLHDVQLAVMAAERVGITPIVRTPGFDPAFILRLLDRGCRASKCLMSAAPRPPALRSRPCATRRLAIAAWRPAAVPPTTARSRLSTTWRSPTARSCWLA